MRPAARCALEASAPGEGVLLLPQGPPAPAIQTGAQYHIKLLSKMPTFQDAWKLYEEWIL